MAGGKTHFITRLGKDAFADIARATWARAGVVAEVTEDAESYTGAAYIFIEEATGNNAIIVAPGAAGRVSVADVEAKAGADRKRGGLCHPAGTADPRRPAGAGDCAGGGRADDPEPRAGGPAGRPRCWRCAISSPRTNPRPRR
jgi:hypothetical protein